MLLPLDMGDNKISASIFHSGDNPVYDVKIWMSNLDLAEEGRQENDLEKRQAAFWKYDVGTIGPEMHQGVGMFNMPDRSFVRLKADIFARNGIHIEMIHARKIHNIWRFAVTMIPFKGNKVQYEQVPKEFPREPDGSYNWDRTS